MKKLLKSILIATASIGTIAGSTAAVVSCGESSPDNTKKYENQDKYNSAINKIKAHLVSSPIDMIRQGIGGEESTREYISQEIIKFVGNVSTTDATKLTSDELATINVGQISVSSTTASFDNLVSSPKDATATLVIPGNEGVDPSTTTITNVPVKYTVSQNDLDNFAQEDLKNLVAEFVNQYDSDVYTFAVKKGDTADIIAHRIEKALNDDITNGDYTSIVSATVTGVTIGTDSKSFNTSEAEGYVGTIDLSNITVTAKPVAGLETYPVNFTGTIKYELYTAPSQDDYQDAIDGIWAYFRYNKPIFTLPVSASKDAILSAIQTSIIAAINEPNWLQSYEKDALKQNISVTDITVSYENINQTVGTGYFGARSSDTLKVTIAPYGSLTPKEDWFSVVKYIFNA